MQEKIIRWGNILAIEINHWVIFTVIICLWVLMGGTRPPVILWGILNLIPVTLFLIRRYTDKGWILWGGHLSCLLLSIMGNRLVGKLAEYTESIPVTGADNGIAGDIVLAEGAVFVVPAAQVMFVVYTAFCVIYSLYLRLSSESQIEICISPVLTTGVIFTSLYITRYQGKLNWDSWYIAVMTGYLCFWFLLYYMRNYLKFVSVNSNCVENLPVKDIFITGVWPIGVYILITIVLLCSLNGKLTGAISQFLERLLPGQSAAQIPEEALRQEARLLDGRKQMSWRELFVAAYFRHQLEVHETWWGFKVSEKIVLTVMPVVITILAVYIIARAGRFLREKFNLYKRTHKKEEYEQAEDLREKCTIVRTKKERKNLYPFLNPAEKIRYLCRRYIGEQAQGTQGEDKLLKHVTIREWSEGAGKRELADIYEKARYSGKKCTKADVKRLRNYIS